MRDARFVYFADGSPLHLRSVLKGSALFAALLAAYRSGAVLAASGAGATVLCDPMVDPRGGAYTVGLGLVEGLAIFPYHGSAADHLRERSIDLLPEAAVLVGIDEETALLRRPGTDVVRRGRRRRHGLLRRQRPSCAPARAASRSRAPPATIHSRSAIGRGDLRGRSALGDLHRVDDDLLGRRAVAVVAPCVGGGANDSIFLATIESLGHLAEPRRSRSGAGRPFLPVTMKNCDPKSPFGALPDFAAASDPIG